MGHFNTHISKYVSLKIKGDSEVTSRSFQKKINLRKLSSSWESNNFLSFLQITYTFVPMLQSIIFVVIVSRNNYISKHVKSKYSQNALEMRVYLEVLHQTSAGDFVPVDLFNIQALRTKQPRNEDFQVFDEFIIYFYKQNQIHHYF